MTEYSSQFNVKKNDTDFLRFIAITLIINSHMDILHPYKYLGTGGAIGNALFFMLSSYGLTLSLKRRPQEFKEYFLNRIRRIYPPVWIELMIVYIPYKIFVDQNNYYVFDIKNLLYYLTSFIFPIHHWFLAALIVYYIISYWLLMKVENKRLLYSILILLITYIYVYITYVDLTRWSVESMYSKYVSYLIIFLFGALIANKKDTTRYSGWIDWAILLILVGVIYVQKYLMLKQITLSLQFIQQLLLLPILYYFIKISRSPMVQEFIMGSTTLSHIIKYISKLTLEIYIIHEYLIITAYNYKMAFPINIFIVTGLTLFISVIIRKAVGYLIDPHLALISIHMTNNNNYIKGKI